MKTQVKNLFMSLEANEVAQLTTQVEETIATGVVAPRRHVFCAADLWNIQRMRKVREPRKMFL